MRIIRDASSEVEKKIICENCGVEIGYLPIDVKEEKHKDYSGSIDIEKVIECPNCNIKIIV